MKIAAQSSKPTSMLGKLPQDGFVRESQLIPSVIPFSHSTLWRKVKDGSFPAPVKLSERVSAWTVQSVRDWMCAASGNA
jgi:prophage regulatory protein